MKLLRQKLYNRDAPEPASAFLALLCCASILHFAFLQQWFVSPILFGTWLLSLLLLHRFASVLLFLILGVFQCAALWHYMPYVEHNFLLSTFIVFSIILLILRRIIRGSQAESQIFVEIRPELVLLVRSLALILYFFAALHKYNTGFLDPEQSAGMSVLRAVLEQTPFSAIGMNPAVWVGWSMTYGALIYETLIFLLLAGRRTWAFGIVLGGAFHLFTAVIMPHFPMMMFACYLLFLPCRQQQEVLGLCQSWLRRKSRTLDPVRIIYLYALFWSVWSWFEFVVIAKGVDIQEALRWHFWLVYINAGLLSVLYLFFLRFIFSQNRFRVRNDILPCPRPGLILLVPLFFFVNCLSPYLGLKMDSSCGMYSNLVPLKPAFNHLFMPASALKIFPYADDLVVLLETDNPELQKAYIEDPTLLPFTELRRRLRSMHTQNPELKVFLKFKRNEQIMIIEDALSDPLLTAPDSYLEKKLVHFNPARLPEELRN